MTQSGSKEAHPLEEEIGKEIDDAWGKAQARMKELDSPYEIFESMYAEPPGYLQEQRDDVKDFMDSEGGKA